MKNRLFFLLCLPILFMFTVGATRITVTKDEDGYISHVTGYKTEAGVTVWEVKASGVTMRVQYLSAVSATITTLETVSTGTITTLDGTSATYDSYTGDACGVTKYTTPSGTSYYQICTNFANDLSTIASSEMTLVIADSQTVSATVTTPSTLMIEVLNSGSLSISSGVTLTTNGSVEANKDAFTGDGVLVLNGSFEAGDYQVFSTSITVTGLSYVNGVWFGMVGDDSTDCTTSFENAIYAAKVRTDTDNSFAPYSGSRLFVPAGIYHISGVTITKPIEIQGAGRRHTIFKAKAASSGYLIKVDATGSSYQNSASNIYGVNFKDFGMSGNTRSVNMCAIQYDEVDRCFAQNLDIRWFKYGAIKFNELRESEFSNIYVRYCGDKENDKPAFDFRDAAGVGDGNNNIHFVNSHIVYSFGDSVIYRSAAGTSCRGITWTNCLFHGVVAAASDCGTHTNAMKGGCLHYIHGVERIRFIGCVFSAGGISQSHIFLEEDTALSEDPSAIAAIGCDFSGNYGHVTSGGISSIGVSGDTVAITSHEFYTGAKFSLASTASLPQDASGDLDGQYFVIYTDANTIQLATTKENAYAGTEIDITNAGSGTITINSRTYFIDVEDGELSLAASTLLTLGTNNASVYNKDTVRGLNSCEFTGSSNIIDGTALTDTMDLSMYLNAAPAYKALGIAGVRNSSTGVTEFTIPTNLDTSVIYTISAGSYGCSGTTTDAGPIETLGVNVVFPAASSINNNKVFGLQKADSGTSALVCTVDGTETIGTSGNTYYASIDAEGDIMWFRVRHDSGISYYFTQGYIQ